LGQFKCDNEHDDTLHNNTLLVDTHHSYTQYMTLGAYFPCRSGEYCHAEGRYAEYHTFYNYTECP